VLGESVQAIDVGVVVACVVQIGRHERDLLADRGG